jgi:hypothetical protein
LKDKDNFSAIKYGDSSIGTATGKSLLLAGSMHKFVHSKLSSMHAFAKIILSTCSVTGIIDTMLFCDSFIYMNKRINFIVTAPRKNAEYREPFS